MVRTLIQRQLTLCAYAVCLNLSTPSIITDPQCEIICSFTYHIKSKLKAKIQQEQFKVKLFSTQQVMAIVFPLSEHGSSSKVVDSLSSYTCRISHLDNHSVCNAAKHYTVKLTLA